MAGMIPQRRPLSAKIPARSEETPRCSVPRDTQAAGREIHESKSLDTNDCVRLRSRLRGLPRQRPGRAVCVDLRTAAVAADADRQRDHTDRHRRAHRQRQPAAGQRPHRANPRRGVERARTGRRGDRRRRALGDAGPDRRAFAPRRVRQPEPQGAFRRQRDDRAGHGAGMGRTQRLAAGPGLQPRAGRRRYRAAGPARLRQPGRRPRRDAEERARRQLPGHEVSGRARRA
jgi:hypothetical protein